MSAVEPLFTALPPVAPLARPIQGDTQLVGLLGGDVRYSLSLRLHNRAFASLGLNWAYLPLPVSPTEPRRLREAVYGLRAMGFVGANVTMPFKERVMEYLDEITPTAQRMGAVNTILHREGRLIGGNTDAEGFVADLQAHGVSWSDRPVVILGAGGAARAVAFGLAESGCARLSIANRTRSRAERLARDLSELFPHQAVDVVPWGRRADASVAGPRALIVNCTPVGMEGVCTPSGEETPWPISPRPEQVVAELVYAPLLTPLLEAAQASGARTISGLGMLVQQAALSFTWWTNRPPPIRQMQAALEIDG